MKKLNKHIKQTQKMLDYWDSPALEIPSAHHLHTIITSSLFILITALEELQNAQIEQEFAQEVLGVIGEHLNVANKLGE